MSYSPCGCWYLPLSSGPYGTRSYLPRHNTRAHATIKDVTSRTILTQTFSNDSDEHLENVVYSFPLYNGMTVVSFAATVGDVRIHGVIKEKQPRREYDEVNKDFSADLLEHLHWRSNVFNTNIGDVPARAQVIIEIVYIGELRYDAHSHGTRFIIPSFIAPDYEVPSDSLAAVTDTLEKPDDAIKVIVDFQSPVGYPIQNIQSPSHPIQVTIGRTSDMSIDTTYMPSRGTVELSLKTTTLDKDFVVIGIIKDSDRSKALLETHATISNQRALVASLVSPFNISSSHGEVVFVVDRSSSMGNKIGMVIEAMKILLKGLPVGIKFNIGSFGFFDDFLWRRSRIANNSNLKKALNHISTFKDGSGPMDMYEPVAAAISRRLGKVPLDVIMLVGGNFWKQAELVKLVKDASSDYTCRFFSLGIESGSSSAHIEGVAAAGKGFSEFVTAGEEMDAKVARLLKGALSPHIGDYSLQVRYNWANDPRAIGSVKATIEAGGESLTESEDGTTTEQAISFDGKDGVDSSLEMITSSAKTDAERCAHLPVISAPSIIQAPRQAPPIYPFPQTTVYLLLDPSTYHLTPEAIILHARSFQGPLSLEIEIEDIGEGETIHQLAAKKAISELEKDGGWLATATTGTDGALVKNNYARCWESNVQREAIRLGVKYQIAGKWCSFMTVNGDVERESVILGTILQPGIPKGRVVCGHPVISYRQLFCAILASMLPRMSDLLPTQLTRKRRGAARNGVEKS
ncbi:von Willebrand factor type A domain-containing protein [Xylaria intraflava]|nr:von Willebrand factor type A domain-containing protein [Xylaria intraflava]